MADHAAQQTTATLSRLLTEQHRLAGALLESINTVAEAIAESGNQDRLEVLLQEKAATLDMLDERNAELQEWLLDNGYAANAVSEAIEALPNNDKLMAFWREFQQLINDCQMQNSANSTLVHARLNYTRQTLNLIAGDEAVNAGGYAENGKPADGKSSRSRAKA